MKLTGNQLDEYVEMRFPYMHRVELDNEKRNKNKRSTRSEERHRHEHRVKVGKCRLINPLVAVFTIIYFDLVILVVQVLA